MNCESCGAPIVSNTVVCQHCGTSVVADIKEVKKGKQITFVKVVGSNNNITINYRLRTFMKNIEVTGSNKKGNFFTNSDIDLSITGSNNKVYISGLDVVNQKELGSNNKIKEW